MPTSLHALLGSLTAALPPGTIATGDDVGVRHQCDWTGRNPCRPSAVIRPRTTEEVSIAAAPVQRGGPARRRPGRADRARRGRDAARRRDRAVPRATLGGRGRGSGRRHDARALGTPLAVVQDAAEAHGLQFPLDLGARGSCTIGGNISTNAGGNRVIRYGMTRALVLGLEAVLADGTIVSSLNAMLKNNAGYDLKQLFIGTEGTLGVVTRAVLRLHPQPGEKLTAFVAVDSFAALARLLSCARSALGGQLGSFEAMWSDYYEFATGALGLTNRPFAERHAYYVLVEVEALDAAHDSDRLERLFARLVEDGIAADAVLARSLEESARLWRVRDAAGELMIRLPNLVAFDVSLPIPRMERYIEEMRERGAPYLGEHPPYVFGHLGDGNLHIVASLKGYQHLHAYDEAVYGALAGFGSVSAEHGIGVLKREWLPLSRQPAEIALMRTLKQALDPKGILNPGRVA